MLFSLSVLSTCFASPSLPAMYTRATSWPQKASISTLAIARIRPKPRPRALLSAGPGAEDPHPVRRGKSALLLVHFCQAQLDRVPCPKLFGEPIFEVGLQGGEVYSKAHFDFTRRDGQGLIE